MPMQNPFHSHTIAAHHGDYPDWHRGRSTYAVWAIDAEQPEVLAHMATCQQGLTPLLLPGYGRQPHITVAACGFPASTPDHDDDFCPAHLEAQIQALSRNRCGLLTVALGPARTFLAAPYLSLQTGEQDIHHLRQQLIAAHPEPGHNPDYRPHLTLGLYGQNHPLAEVDARLAALPAASVHLEITHLSLMSYQARAIGGPLTEIARFDLDNGELEETSPGALQRLFTHSNPTPG